MVASLTNMPLQEYIDHSIEIIATVSDVVQNVYSFYDRRPNKV